MRKILFFLLLVAVVFSAGCNLLPFGLDESDIEKVIGFYYSPGKPPPDGKETYRLLSSQSRTQITEEQWVQRASGFKETESAKVLRKEGYKGNTYAVVSWEVGPDTNKAVLTDTWILEDNKWRRLTLPRNQEEVEKAFNNGDYPTAKTKAEEWLSLDPFSIEAYRRLAFSIARSGIRELKGGDRSLNDIVSAVLAINENDSSALFLAVTYTKDTNIAKTFLKRLENHYSYNKVAYNFAIKISNPNERLAFVEGIKHEPASLMLRLLTLAELRRWEDFRKLCYEQDAFTSIKIVLDDSDPSFAAGHAGDLGLVAHKSGDRETAQKWLEYGVTRDPNNETIRKLAAVLSC
jgi:hypothetical protein